MDPKIIAAEKSSTKPGDWEFSEGPKAGIGAEECWLKNMQSGQKVYICIDKGIVTHCEFSRIEAPAQPPIYKPGAEQMTKGVRKPQ
jgi:hypothetical protein